MDPGLGLIVNSLVPNEVEASKPPPKPSLQLPDGFLEKPHVRHALKYLTDDEQREKALGVAMAWKKKFAAEKWKPVVAAIEAASKEDNVRSSPNDTYLHELSTTVHPAERPRAMTTDSAPTVPQATSQLMPARTECTRLHTATASLPLRRTPAPTTPRTYRWDVMPSGPVTPLSPMPIGNSFSGGGFWGKSTPQVEQHETSAPVTAIDDEPVSPVIPNDADARALYEKVKTDVDALARRYCLARHNMRSSGENGFVPATMVRPKDVMEAAQVALHSRKTKLKTAIIQDLPVRLRNHALEEAALRRPLSIQDEQELPEQNDWMNDKDLMVIPEILNKKDYMPPPTHLAVSILDEQREALRIFRTQRKSSDLELTETALEAAWAVRILEDAERLVASELDGSSSGGDDDDDGYSYGNFLRSIKSEMSTSTSSGALASMVDELSNSDLSSLRSRANTHQTVNSMGSREFRFPQRSSASPVKENRLPMRLSETNNTNSGHKHSNSLHRRTDLCISTEAIAEVPSGELSPEDREFRHRGPNLTDLNNWAEELKKMEAMRADRQRSPTFHRRAPNRNNGLSSSTHQQSPTKRMSVNSINTRISPTKQLHSRFSSSSSLSTNLLKPLPRPAYANRSASTSLSVSGDDSKLSMLDHEYHQLKTSKAPTNTHRRNASEVSIHDSLRRHQHLQSTGSVQVLVKGSTKAAEQEWMSELKRMESRERIRQGHERG